MGHRLRIVPAVSQALGEGGELPRGLGGDLIASIARP